MLVDPVSFQKLFQLTFLAPSLVAFSRAASKSSSWPMLAWKKERLQSKTKCNLEKKSIHHYQVTDDFISILNQPNQNTGGV